MRKVLLFLMFSALACGKLKETLTTPTTPGGTTGEPIDPTATFTRVQTEVFSPNCTIIGCHDAIFQQQQLSLAPGRAYGQIVGQPSTELAGAVRVIPLDADNSYLYRKIIGKGITGDQMPQASTPLTDAQTKLVRDWIRRGAPND
jgi:hypothetical protein